VAILDDTVYVGTLDCYLVALDAKTGSVRWETKIEDNATGHSITAAPLAIDGKIIVGISGGEAGIRGFLDAYDAGTGKLAWRCWTIPGPGEPGHETWGGDSWKTGSGSTWVTGSYDPELNLIYWGTGNPGPDWNGDARPGDNLYTCSLLAIDAATGKMKWHFQFTPHDLYDYDATETAVLVDAEYKGKPRKLLLEANRNGFLYVLDRSTGEFLSAARFAEKMNWAEGIDSKGRPILSEKSAKPTPEGSVVCPGFSGATNWYSPSFNPDTRTLYFMAHEACSIYSSGAQKPEEGKTYYGTGVRRTPGERGQKILLAYDLDTATFRWRYPQAPGRSSAGTMTTASGLVFFGDDTEAFEAVEAKTGRPLWHFSTGQSMRASPMSYSVNGKQYVAIATGSDVFSFALP